MDSSYDVREAIWYQNMGTSYIRGVVYISRPIYQYICYIMWINATRAELIADTIAWFPSNLTIPILSSTDCVIALAQDIIISLEYPYYTSVFVAITNTYSHDIYQLFDIFMNATTTTTPICPPPGFVAARPVALFHIVRMITPMTMSLLPHPLITTYQFWHLPKLRG